MQEPLDQRTLVVFHGEMQDVVPGRIQREEISAAFAEEPPHDGKMPGNGISDVSSGDCTANVFSEGRKHPCWAARVRIGFLTWEEQQKLCQWRAPHRKRGPQHRTLSVPSIA